MPSIAAVIPTWNGSSVLASVLKDLSAQTLRPEQVIVVDNGSSDDTGSVSAQAGAELVRFESNRGFAAAVNAGIRHARADWILILNNDVVLPPDWLERLHCAAETTNAAFATGKLLSYWNPQIIDGSWDLLSRGAHAWRCGFGRIDGTHWSVRRPIDFAPMTAALFHRSVFDQIGFLDERFEAYYEDVDFGLRCAMAGLAGIYEPLAVAQHMGKKTLGKSSDRVLYLTARNQIFLVAKHYSAATIRKWFWPMLVGQCLSIAGAAQNGRLRAAIRGLIDAARSWKGMRTDATEAGTLERILTRSESEIRSLQKELGYDPYWRLYFRLVRSG